MREIKFRAWDKRLKRFHRINEIYLKDTGGVFLDCDPHGVDMSNIVRIYPDNNFEINLFTGLRDKNSKEIFEGDFVKDLSGNIGLVFWNKEEANFLIQFGEESQGMYVMWQWSEVCGNLHENPELLNEQP